jgi:transposase
MKSELREKAVQLRKGERLSYSAIQKRLKVSRSTLSYWLKDLPLSEAEIRQLKQLSWQKGEAARERYRNTMSAKKDTETKDIYRKQKKKVLPLTARDLYIAGLMLYVGEGDKRNPYRVALANSDPFVLSLFIKWLIKFLKIPRDKIRLGLHLYTNMDIAEESKFWQDTLGFGEKSFYKNQVHPVSTPFSYTDGKRHGTCTVYVIGSKPKREILQAIQVISDYIMRS